MKLLPYPRFLERQSGSFLLPARATLRLDGSLSPEIAREISDRLKDALTAIGVGLIPGSALASRAVSGAPAGHIIATRVKSLPTVERSVGTRHRAHSPEDYKLTIHRHGVLIEFRETAGLHAAVATLRQLLREYGRRLPCLQIRDWPDFPKRGVMLDISRGRVPRLETLLDLAGQLADFKINELQLYTEHTFAYRHYAPVWRGWGALTGDEIEKLDAHCRRLGIELVPNQNSFGHLRQWLAYPPLKKLAEVSEPWPDEGGAFLRYPSTLAPTNPGTLPFLRGLYDELLPHFRSGNFNVGCDETWDLGRGQSRALCEKIGKGRVYLQFLKKIHRELSARKKRMMFWDDIILHHPELVRELPRDVIALNWGYEAGHPFARETRTFAAAKIPFYVCPGTSTWMTMIGRHDNAFANLREAATAGRRHGASGYLITDWGDGGHPQPLAVSMLPYLFGAALSWCAATADEKLLAPVANRDVFHDPTGETARAALALGLAHRKFRFLVPNLTPFGAVIAAPPPAERELFCRDGLKYYARIPGKKIRAAMAEVEAQRAALRRARPVSREGKILDQELDLAARMAIQSCQFMLWQQMLASGHTRAAAATARRAMRELRALEHDFAVYWPLRNKATPRNSATFLQWRGIDYRQGVLPYPPDARY